MPHGQHRESGVLSVRLRSRTIIEVKTDPHKRDKLKATAVVRCNVSPATRAPRPAAGTWRRLLRLTIMLAAMGLAEAFKITRIPHMARPTGGRTS